MNPTEPMNTPTTNQAPKEVPSSSDAATGIELIVCKDIAERQRFGLAKYGTTVADNPLPLRNWLRHAYEEALDLPIYLRRAIAEIEEKKPESDAANIPTPETDAEAFEIYNSQCPELRVAVPLDVSRSLERRLILAQRRVKEMEKERDEAKAQREHWKGRVEPAEGNLAGRNESHNALLLQRDTALAELAKVKAGRDADYKALLDQHDDLKLEADSDITALRKERDDSIAALENYIADYHKIERENDRLTNALDTLTAHIGGIRASRDDHHRNSLRRAVEIEELRHERDALRATAEADKARLTRALDRIGFYLAGTEFQNISDRILIVLSGKDIDAAMQSTQQP